MPSESNTVRNLFEPDNSNVKRGFILVCLATMLGLFLSIQVIGQTPEIRVAGNETVSSDEAPEDSATISSSTTSTTSRVTFSSNLGPAEVVAAPTTSTSIRDPDLTAFSLINVRVYNGSRVAGAATAATQLIGAEGYEMLTPGDTPSRVTDSAILYSRDFEDEARELAAFLDASDVTIALLTTQTSPVDSFDDIDVMVVQGRDGELS